MKPYVGNEKFIFISYAHKDSAEAMKIINALQEKGYRVWYDEGITPASDYMDYIANHIFESGYFIPFFSRSYMISDNCNKEIKYAERIKKNIFPVYIEECELSKGLDMLVGQLQYCQKYKYKDMDSFIEKVGEAQGISEFKSSPAKNSSVEKHSKSSEIITQNDIDDIVDKIFTEFEKSLIRNENFTLEEPRHVVETPIINNREKKKEENYSDKILQSESNTPDKDVRIQTLSYPSGYLYTGETLNGMRHGFGKYYFSKPEVKADRYEGEWKNNKKDGHGVFLWSTGYKYEGEWENDKRSGHGVYVYTGNRNEKYDGEWKDDKRNGHGIYTCKDSKYDGEWKNNKREGFGTIYAGEYIYRGSWLNNREDGEGEILNEDGTVRFRCEMSRGHFVKRFL